jgi:hypothetical protein
LPPGFDVFDPRVLDMRFTATGEHGERTDGRGFVYQNFTTTDIDGREATQPIGHPEMRFRYVPTVR